MFIQFLIEEPDDQVEWIAVNKDQITEIRRHGDEECVIYIRGGTEHIIQHPWVEVMAALEVMHMPVVICQPKDMRNPGPAPRKPGQ